MSAPGTSSGSAMRSPSTWELVVVRGVVVPERRCATPSRAPPGTSSNASPTSSSGRARPNRSRFASTFSRLASRKREAVDADEALAVVAEHRRDQARAVVDADLDVRLVRARDSDAARLSSARTFSDARFSTRRRPAGSGGRADAPSAGSRRRAPGARGGSGRRPRRYRWLVTPARSGSSDGGSYQDRA